MSVRPSLRPHLVHPRCLRAAAPGAALPQRPGAGPRAALSPGEGRGGPGAAQRLQKHRHQSALLRVPATERRRSVTTMQLRMIDSLICFMFD